MKDEILTLEGGATTIMHLVPSPCLLCDFEVGDGWGCLAGCLTAKFDAWGCCSPEREGFG